MTLVESTPPAETTTDAGPVTAEPKPVVEGTEAKRRAVRALRVRDRAVPRGARRRARRLGLGPGLDGPRVVRGLLHASPVSASPSDTTGTSPTDRSRRKRPLHIALAIAGSMAIEGPVDPVGSRSPPPSRVQRSRRAIPIRPGATETPYRRAVKGLVLRPRRLAVRRRAHQSREVRARSAARPRHLCASIGCSGCGRPSRFWRRCCSAG